MLIGLSFLITKLQFKTAIFVNNSNIYKIERDYFY